MNCILKNQREQFLTELHNLFSIIVFSAQAVKNGVHVIANDFTRDSLNFVKMF
jgi:hypothetical protein